MGKQSKKKLQRASKASRTSVDGEHNTNNELPQFHSSGRKAKVILTKVKTFIMLHNQPSCVILLITNHLLHEISSWEYFSDVVLSELY